MCSLAIAVEAVPVNVEDVVTEAIHVVAALFQDLAPGLFVFIFFCVQHIALL